MNEPRSLTWERRIKPPKVDRPGHTCGDIDCIIDELEKLRSANQALRENAEAWEELAEEYFSLAKEWESYAESLQEEIAK